jgi:hypothetical protein
MNRSKPAITLMTIAAFGLGMSSKALAGTVQCESCSDEDMLAYAEARIQELRYYGPLYMVSIERGVVRKFAFFTDETEHTNPEFDPISHWVAPVAVEPEIVEAIVNAHGTAMQARSASSEIAVPIGDEYPRDAHDALERPDRAHHLAEYINTTVPGFLYGEFAHWLNNLQPSFFNPAKVLMPIPVRY